MQQFLAFFFKKRCVPWGQRSLGLSPSASTCIAMKQRAPYLNCPQTPSRVVAAPDDSAVVSRWHDAHSHALGCHAEVCRRVLLQNRVQAIGVYILYMQAVLGSVCLQTELQKVRLSDSLQSVLQAAPDFSCLQTVFTIPDPSPGMSLIAS